MATLAGHYLAMTDITTPQPDTSDRRGALVAAYSLAADVAAGVRSDQLAGSTPCPDYDVATLIDHLVGASWRTVALGRGETPAGAEEFSHVELTDAPGQLRRAGAAAAAAWTDDRLSVSTAMPWGETYDGSTLVNMYLSELVAHTWDLSVATGQTLACDEDLASAALAAAHAMLRPEYRDSMGIGNPFGAEQPAGDDATSLERFAAFMGRRIDWRP